MKTKKCLAVFMAMSAFCAFFAGCGVKPEEKPPADYNLYQTDCRAVNPESAEDLPADYTLEQAKEDGCVVYENGDISSGQPVWDAFLHTSSSGQPTAVRLGFYYTLDDPSRYSADYYESIKDEYPALYIEDLEFDGSSYTLTQRENQTEITKTYQYLMRYEGEKENPEASYSSYVRYVLVNDNSITWDDICRSLLSSTMEKSVDFHTVYVDLI